jgi:nickel transport protein
LKRMLVLMVVALLLWAGAASAHRMFVVQQLTLDLYVFFDDGTPAGNADVKLYSDGKLFMENVTDASGKFSIVLPRKGIGELQYEVSGGGHTEKGSININNTPLQAGTLGLSMVGPLPLIRRKRRCPCYPAGLSGNSVGRSRAG